MDLLISMCQHWQATHKWMVSNYPQNINATARKKYPVIQGSTNQMILRELSKKECSLENCKTRQYSGLMKML